MNESKLRINNDTYEIYDLEMGGYVLSVTYLKPLKSTKGHQHPWDEAYYISSGIGIIQIGDKTMDIYKGKFVAISPDTFHRVTNTSMSDLVFVCAWRN